MAESVHKEPQRTCIACRQTAGKRTLVRFVRTPNGEVVLDASGKMNGRGAYVCLNGDCFSQARRHRKLGSALKVAIDTQEYERLQRDLNDLAREKDAQ